MSFNKSTRDRISLKESSFEIFRDQQLIRFKGTVHDMLPPRIFEPIFILAEISEEHIKDPTNHPTPLIQEKTFIRKLRTIEDPNKPGQKLFFAATLTIDDIFKSEFGKKIYGLFIEKKNSPRGAGAFYCLKI